MLGDWHRVCANIQNKLDTLPARLQPLLRDGSLNPHQESDAQAYAHLATKEDNTTVSLHESDSRNASAGSGVGLAMLADHVPPAQTQKPAQGMKSMLAAQETAYCAASEILEHVGIARLVLESGACAAACAC